MFDKLFWHTFYKLLTFYTSIEIIFTVGYRTEKDLSDTNGYQGPRGFRQRAALTEDGKVAVFLSPIFLPIFLQPKCLPCDRALFPEDILPKTIRLDNW